MSAPSGEERTLNAAAQVERAALCLRRFSGAQPVCGVCAAETAVSEASGPRVSGCIRAPRYFLGLTPYGSYGSTTIYFTTYRTVQ